MEEHKQIGTDTGYKSFTHSHMGGYSMNIPGKVNPGK